MIDTIRYTESGQFVPYHNLAVEKYLLETCGERECIPVSYTHLDVYKRQVDESDL